jgi:hypothetical protein
MICDLEKLLGPTLCGSEPIGGALARAVRDDVRKAEALLRTAGRTPVGHRARLFRRADRRLDAIVRASMAHRGKHAIAPACQATIARVVAQRRGRLAALTD